MTTDPDVPPCFTPSQCPTTYGGGGLTRPPSPGEEERASWVFGHVGRLHRKFQVPPEVVSSTASGRRLYCVF